MTRTLSHDEARRFYDDFGARQDSQGFYERPALERLIEPLALAEARAVVEFGCGTGRLAAELLEHHLPPACRYFGIDVSVTMVRLASARVARFGPRAEVVLTQGETRIEAADASFDRFLSTYVFDLLADAEMEALLREAHRVLEPGGRLGVAGLTHGERGLPRVVSGLWERVHRMRPSLVGGCRPVSVREVLPASAWRILHHSVVTPYGIPSECLVAERC
jgi:ubiquinone/menaquinone biosynthesis C-methylase UbiE